MLDLVESVVDRFHGPLLVLCLARPELLDRRPTWAAGKPRTVTTTLPPLGSSDSRRLAEALLADAPTSVIDRVCETAEGNPLFLEQLAAMLSDRGSLVEGRWRGASDGEVEIPIDRPCAPGRPPGRSGCVGASDPGACIGRGSAVPGRRGPCPHR